MLTVKFMENGKQKVEMIKYIGQDITAAILRFYPNATNISIETGRR